KLVFTKPSIFLSTFFVFDHRQLGLDVRSLELRSAKLFAQASVLSSQFTDLFAVGVRVPLRKFTIPRFFTEPFLQLVDLASCRGKLVFDLPDFGIVLRLLVP